MTFPETISGFDGAFIECNAVVFFSVAVWVAGIAASIGVAVLGAFCFLSVLQLAMLTSKEKVVMKYSVVVIFKLALGLLASKYLAHAVCSSVQSYRKSTQL